MSLLEYLSILNIIVIPLVAYLLGHYVKHEKCHARIELLLKQVCKKLDIIDNGG